WPLYGPPTPAKGGPHTPNPPRPRPFGVEGQALDRPGVRPQLPLQQQAEDVRDATQLALQGRQHGGVVPGPEGGGQPVRAQKLVVVQTVPPYEVFKAGILDVPLAEQLLQVVRQVDPSPVRDVEAVHAEHLRPLEEGGETVLRLPQSPVQPAGLP